jgi:hypothetical protein
MDVRVGCGMEPYLSGRPDRLRVGPAAGAWPRWPATWVQRYRRAAQDRGLRRGGRHGRAWAGLAGAAWPLHGVSLLPAGAGHRGGAVRGRRAPVAALVPPQPDGAGAKRGRVASLTYPVAAFVVLRALGLDVPVVRALAVHGGGLVARGADARGVRTCAPDGPVTDRVHRPGHAEHAVRADPWAPPCCAASGAPIRHDAGLDRGPVSGHGAGRVAALVGRRCWRLLLAGALSHPAPHQPATPPS